MLINALKYPWLIECLDGILVWVAVFFLRALDLGQLGQFVAELSLFHEETYISLFKHLDNSQHFFL